MNLSAPDCMRSPMLIGMIPDGNGSSEYVGLHSRVPAKEGMDLGADGSQKMTTA